MFGSDFTQAAMLRLSRAANLPFDMDMIYRLFYTVISMSCMAVAMLPLILVLRFLFRRLPRKFCVALWVVFFLRAVCPIGMSSPVCLVGAWNRQFHRLLRSIGLEMRPDGGLLSSWRMVYLRDVEVTVPYMICSVIGVLGAIVLLCYRLVWWWKLRPQMETAENLFDNVYQAAGAVQPLRAGILRRRIYLPAGLSAEEMKNVLLHQQAHCDRGDDLLELFSYLVCCLHWWNPFLWAAYYLAAADREMACDESAVRRLGWRGTGVDSHNILNGYIQDNFHREDEGTAARPLYFPVVFSELAASTRTEHLLYLERASVWKEAVAAFLVSVCLIGGFGLSALHTAWNGGAWSAEEQAGGGVFSENVQRGVTNEVITGCDTETANGTPVRLELIMTQGTFQSGQGYRGQCILRMRDEKEDSLGSLLLSKVFLRQDVQQFDENTLLAVEDYNEDGVMEVTIGQQAQVKISELDIPSAASGSSLGASRSSSAGALSSSGLDDREVTVQEYYLINIEDKALTVVSEPVYVSDVTEIQAGSMSLSSLEGLGGVIQTTAVGRTRYYVWDEKEKMYSPQALSDEDLQARMYRRNKGISDGEEFTHTLKNEKGKTVIQVDGVADETGGQSIQEILLNPRGVERASDTRKFKNVNGYFRDLQWAQTDGESERFAVLSYNGKVGGSFVLYDMKSKKACYRQEDGNRILQEIFDRYNGKEITFDQKDAVVYRLMDITGEDTLKVTFAATAEEGVTVQGTFLYKLSTREMSGLQFTRNLDQQEEEQE